MNCVLGVLTTDKGLKIKAEMLSWLSKYFQVTTVEQEPPGKSFEYPALKVLIDKVLKDGKSYLYLHTKGAINDTDVNFKVRQIWKHEFSTIRYNDYINRLMTISPVVVCPWTGLDRRRTWFNGFMINPKAAAILKESFHLDSDRYYYERMFVNLKKIRIKGVISEHCEESKDVLSDMLQYYKKIS